VSAEQAVILALLIAAFAAGWFAGGGRGRGALAPGENEEDVAPVESPALEGPPVDEPHVGPAEPPLPEERITPAHDRDGEPLLPPGWPGADRDDAAPAAPLPATGRALDRAVAAFETALDRWVDDGEEISPAGRAALGEFERALARLDTAVARLAEAEPASRAPRIAGGALDALREAAELLARYRAGHRLDADTSRELSALEGEVEDARAQLRGAAPG
jgi:hypothetical protein